MLIFSPEPDWLPLTAAPLTIATGDAANRWTFLNELKYALQSFKPRYRYNEHDQVLSQFSLGGFEILARRDVSRFAVTYEEYWYYDAPFWDFPHLAKTDYLPDFDIDANVLAGVSRVWFTAVAVTDQELARNHWKIMARPQSITAPLVEIPPDVWMHFEITDWLRGVAKSDTGETLYSIHLAPHNYALNSDPEGFKIAHPESILVDGELVPNLSLYRLRTAADHPQDIWRLVEPEVPQDGTTEGPGEIPHAVEIEPDAWRQDGFEDEEAPAKISSSSGQEKACERHLKQLMQERPTSPIPKNDCQEEAKTLFPGVSKKGFERAWAKAIAESGALHWRKPGRRKRS
ncbi:hypothetical protein AAII07_56435 [Microvirga sp. 0TCS3.31]